MSFYEVTLQVRCEEGDTAEIAEALLAQIMAGTKWPREFDINALTVTEGWSRGVPVYSRTTKG